MNSFHIFFAYQDAPYHTLERLFEEKLLTYSFQVAIFKAASCKRKSLIELNCDIIHESH